MATGVSSEACTEPRLQAGSPSPADPTWAFAPAREADVREKSATCPQEVGNAREGTGGPVVQGVGATPVVAGSMWRVARDHGIRQFPTLSRT